MSNEHLCTWAKIHFNLPIKPNPNAICRILRRKKELLKFDKDILDANNEQDIRCSSTYSSSSNNKNKVEKQERTFQPIQTTKKKIAPKKREEVVVSAKGRGEGSQQQQQQQETSSQQVIMQIMHLLSKELRCYSISGLFF